MTKYHKLGALRQHTFVLSQPEAEVFSPKALGRTVTRSESHAHIHKAAHASLDAFPGSGVSSDPGLRAVADMASLGTTPASAFFPGVFVSESFSPLCCADSSHWI